MPKGRPKKLKEEKVIEVVVDDVIIDNPEEVTIEDVLENEVVRGENGDYVTQKLPPLEIIEEPEPIVVDEIIETGKVINGKREFKNTTKGICWIED